MESFGKRLRTIRRERGLTQKELAEKLGLAQTTIANYERDIRFPSLEILNSLAGLFDVSLDFLIGEKKKRPNNPGEKEIIFEKEVHEEDVVNKNGKEKKIELNRLQQIYLAELLKGNQREVYDLLVYAMKEGRGLKELYSHVIEPSLVEVGRRWEENQLSVGHEHYFSGATERILAQLHTHMFQGKKKQYRAVLLCTQGEGHSIGLQMVNNLLEEDGWETYFLGTNVPTDSFIALLEEKEIDLVALSVTMEHHLNSAETLIRTIQNSTIKKEVKILVGGRAFRYNPLLWKSLGAHGFAANFGEVVEVANRLVDRE